MSTLWAPAWHIAKSFALTHDSSTLMMLRTWPPYFLNRASYFKISNEHMLSWKINFIMTHFYRFLTVSSSYTNVALHCSCIEREASPHLRLFRPTHVKLTLQATGKAPFLWNVMWNIKACQYAIFWSSLICLLPIWNLDVKSWKFSTKSIMNICITTTNGQNCFKLHWIDVCMKSYIDITWWKILHFQES